MDVEEEFRANYHVDLLEAPIMYGDDTDKLEVQEQVHYLDSKQAISFRGYKHYTLALSVDPSKSLKPRHIGTQSGLR